MEAALRCFLPTMLGTLSFEIHPHLCKQDLLEKLPQRLRGYAKWLPPTWRIVVLVDRDDDDCHELKRRLEKIAIGAGLATRSSSRRNRYQVVNRIVIEELEAWYFGDWQAVLTAYPGVSPHIPKKSKFRNPDAILGGTWECLQRVLQSAGLFEGGLRKIEAAREIAPHMNPQRNTSPSFRLFCSTLTELIKLK
jgi:hypothetical protein